MISISILLLIKKYDCVDWFENYVEAIFPMIDLVERFGWKTKSLISQDSQSFTSLSADLFCNKWLIDFVY